MVILADEAEESGCRHRHGILLTILRTYGLQGETWLGPETREHIEAELAGVGDHDVGHARPAAVQWERVLHRFDEEGEEGVVRRVGDPGALLGGNVTRSADTRATTTRSKESWKERGGS